MKNLKNIFQIYIENNKYPGIQWEIINNNISKEGLVGFKNLEKKETICKNTIYRIWSMTKPVVAIAAMQLVENQKLSLNDTINIYLPEFNNLKVLNSFNSEISDLIDLKRQPTIKDLLLHTAGFSYNFLSDSLASQYDKINLFSSSNSTLKDEINLLSSLPLLFQPGTNWRYSVSMDVLGRILEVIENNSLQKILKKQIFEPLCMYDTTFCLEEKNIHRLMRSYEYDEINNKLTEHILEPQRIGNFGHPLNNKNFARGGHGLYSTLKDFMIFIEMLHTGMSKDGKKIISKNSIDIMKRNHLQNNLFPIEITNITNLKNKNYVNDLEGYGWGLGFRTLMNIKKNNNRGNIGEFGWSGAASTYFLVDHEKNISALLMTQVLNGDPNLKKDFYNFIYSKR